MLLKYLFCAWLSRGSIGTYFFWIAPELPHLLLFYVFGIESQNVYNFFHMICISCLIDKPDYRNAYLCHLIFDNLNIIDLSILKKNSIESRLL